MLYAVERNLAAYETGDKNLLLETVLASRWVRSVDDAERFLDEVLALPFNRQIAEHFA